MFGRRTSLSTTHTNLALTPGAPYPNIVNVRERRNGRWEGKKKKKKKKAECENLRTRCCSCIILHVIGKRKKKAKKQKSNKAQRILFHTAEKAEERYRTTPPPPWAKGSVMKPTMHASGHDEIQSSAIKVQKALADDFVTRRRR